MQVDHLVPNVQHFLVESAVNLHRNQRQQRCCELLSDIVDNQDFPEPHTQLQVVSKPFVVLIQNFVFLVGLIFQKLDQPFRGTASWVQQQGNWCSCKWQFKKLGKMFN